MRRLAVTAAICLALLASISAMGAGTVFVRSDGTWRCAETTPSGWNMPGFDDSDWLPAYAPVTSPPQIMRDAWKIDSVASSMWHPGSAITACFRKSFRLEGPPLPGARLAFYGGVHCALYVNGRRIPLMPGQPYPGVFKNITPYLRQGENVIAFKATAEPQGGAVFLSAMVPYGSESEGSAAGPVLSHNGRVLFVLQVIVAAVFGVCLLAAGVAIARGTGRPLVPAALARLKEFTLSESLWLFLAVFFALGCFVNTENQDSWSLQHAGVESIAERGTLYVDGTDTQQFIGVGDTYDAPDGHRYPCNAHGNYVAGAGVYWVLRHAFGLAAYVDRRPVTPELVTFFTVTVCTALTVMLLYRLAHQITGSRLGGFFVATAYGFGTLGFVYSGTLYQHQSAVFFYTAAFYFAFQTFRRDQPHWAHPVLSGFFLGLGPLFSYASMLVGLCIGLYFLSFLRLRQIALFAAGFAFGIAPVMAINWTYFGSPLTTVYNAKADVSVKLELSWALLRQRLSFYFTSPSSSIFAYSPILALAVPGLLLFPRGYWRERLTIVAAVVLTYAHLMVTENDGAAQFGSRMIIPFLPLLSLGLIPYWMKGRGGVLARRPFKVLFLLLLLASLFFSALGAMGPTMYFQAKSSNGWYTYLDNWLVQKKAAWASQHVTGWYVDLNNWLANALPSGVPWYPITSVGYLIRPVVFWLALPAGAMAIWRFLARWRKERAA